MEIVKEFGETTTMHGVQKLTKSKFKRRQILWILAITFALCMFGLQLYLLINQYLRRPTRTTMELSRGAVRFPDVSVCNMRNLDVDVVYSLTKLFGNDIHPYIMLRWNVTYASPEFEMAFLNLIGHYYHLYRYYDIYPEMFNTLFSRSNLVSNFDKDLLVKGAVPTWELILRCSWQGSPCSSENFTVFYDNYYSNCVTFNAPAEEIGSEGAESGLSFVALVGGGMIDWTGISEKRTLIPGLQENNYPLAGDEGLRVVIHPAGTRPLPSIEGYDIPPGFSGSFALKVTNNSLLARPYGNCRTDTHTTDGYSYRVLACLRKCIQEHIIEKCNCVDARLPYETDMIKATRFCGKVDRLSSDCLQSIDVRCLKPLQEAANNLTCAKLVAAEMISEESLVEDCDCYPPCKETLYDLTYGLSRWPADHETDFVYTELLLGDRFFHKLNASNPSAIKLKIYKDYFTFQNRDNCLRDFAKVNVYFADLTITKTTQVADYGMIDLMSDIGGIMGLWLGMSLLTLVEFLQLAVDLLIHAKQSSRSTTKIENLNVTKVSVISVSDTPKKIPVSKSSSREKLLTIHGVNNGLHYAK